MKSHAIKNMKYTGNVFYLNLFYVQSFNDAVNDSELFFTHAFQGVVIRKKVGDRPSVSSSSPPVLPEAFSASSGKSG